MSSRGPRWRYSRWDGTSPPPSPDADEVLAGVADDLLYHGDLDAAIRRLLQRGFTTSNGQRVAGLRELLEQIRQRRADLAASSGLDDMTRRVADELESILREERDELDRPVTGGVDGSDDPAARRAAERHSELDLLPSGLAERLRALSHYDFASASARDRFLQLVSDLRRDLTQLQLDDAASSLASAGPEEREHLRAGLDALNRMLEQRSASERLDPSFAEFNERYGDIFPPAKDLEELLEKLAARMAAVSELMASMSPRQRAELEALAAELLQDVDLAWQMDRLSMNLREALPSLPLGEPNEASGETSFSLGSAGAIVADMSDLYGLEQLLRGVAEPGALAEIDPEPLSELLGPESAASLRALAELTRRLEEAGLIARRGGRLSLTPRGLRRLGSQALSELFARLRRDRFGEHALTVPGLGHDRDISTRPYAFGDPFELNVQETIRNAVLRRAGESQEITATIGKGMELPIRLVLDDFAIEEREQLASASTVVALDLSLSMPMRDNFLAGKKVAIALQALIASRYPRDFLGLVGFSATARTISAAELPEVSWDFAYGTNLQHALCLSRRLLAHRDGAKQIIVITDGEPTAHILDDGEVFFDYPPARETLEATLSEVVRCTRERIVINTFVLDATGPLRHFVETMARLNKGRAFFTTPEALGEYVLVDFVKSRTTVQRRLRPGA